MTVYRGWLSPGQFVWSPFVTKLEARLRFAGLSYKTEAGSTRASPRGKIPYIDIPFDPSISQSQTKTIADSGLIVKELVSREVLPDLNAALTPQERAFDLSLRALLEEKLIFYHGWERWTQNFYVMRDHILETLSWPMRFVVGNIIYSNTVKTLHGQGTGRYSGDEIAGFRREIWESVNVLLVESKTALGTQRSTNDGAEEPFWVLGGENPTEADATVFGFVVSVLVCDAAPDSRSVVRSFPVVMEYAKRIQGRYFPDYEMWKEEKER